MVAKLLVTLAGLIVGFEAAAVFLGTWPTITDYAERYPAARYSFIGAVVTVCGVGVAHLAGAI